MPETVLEEAQRIIYGDREETYGRPDKNLNVIADLWAVYLRARFGEDLALTYEDVCWMMVLLKTARGAHQYKRDNVTDVCGYAALLARIKESDGASS